MSEHLEKLLKDKLKLLEKDTIIYLHPLSREDIAEFGIFEKIQTRRKYIISKFDELRLIMLCTFQFNKKYGLWIPDLTTSGDGLAYPLTQLCKENIVYAGKEVKKGMESNSNPNYILTMSILAKYLQNRGKKR